MGWRVMQRDGAVVYVWALGGGGGGGFIIGFETEVFK